MLKNLSRYYYNQGLQAARESRIGAAVQNLIKAVSYDSGNITAWNLAGFCYHRLGEYKTAEYCWTQSLNRRGEENTAGAYLADLKKALQESSPYFEQVSLLCRRKKYGEAAAITSREICSRLGMSTNLLKYVGVLRLLDGRIRGAIRCWERVVSADQEDSDARLYLAEVEGSLRFKWLKWKERLFKRDDIQGL